MQKTFIILGIFFVIIVGLLVITKKQGILPNSFTMKLHGDFTSSGAGRLNEGVLVFANGKLVSGKASRTFGDLYGNTYYECHVNNNEWVDAITGGNCHESVITFPITKEGLENKIKLGEIKPAGTCEHLDMCYELTP